MRIHGLCLFVCFTFLTLFCFPLLSHGQITITPTATVGCSPLVVNFSTNATNVSSYYWDFGNGNFSSVANPGATYLQGGLFTVSLTLTFNNGSTQTISQPGLIEVFDNPQADFTGNIQVICQGQTVSFTDQSLPGSAPILSWSWDFGDGSPLSPLQNPSHIYQFAGIFGVTLIVTDINGCTNLLTENAYIEVKKTPNAAFSVASAFGCTTPFTANFNSLLNPPGVTHSWTFGLPGSSSLVANPNFTYTSNGVYTVRHIVTNSIGCADTVIKPNLINVGASSVSIQVSKSSLCPGQTVNFFCGAPVGSTVLWNFGVGAATSTICNPSFTYNTPGTYIATAVITDPTGCTFNASQPIVVNPIPQPNFSAPKTFFCDPPFTTNFTYTGTGGITNYQWQFGAGGASSQANPTFTYPVLPVVFQPYNYNVSLTVTDGNGCQNTITKLGFVETGQTLAGMRAIPKDGCAPLPVAFQDSSISNDVITSWTWDFGDGSPTSNQQNNNHTYQTTGSWDVSLIITTQTGCTDTLVNVNYIMAGDTPVADFVVDTVENCASNLFYFTNLSVGATDYFWDYGDGITSMGFEPAHKFVDTGYMDIMLIAYDRGCPDTLIQPQMVYVHGPIARFGPGQYIGCTVPDTVQFFDNSINAQHYRWNFGDLTTLADTSNLFSPDYIYQSEGSYIVSLIVNTDSTGCADTTYRSVQLLTVEASYVPDTTAGCDPVAISFTDLSTNPVQWFWNFGDGTPVSQVANPVHTYNGSGKYSVRLNVRNALGCVDDTLITNLISVFKPDVSFTPSDFSVCVPQTVSFVNNTTSLAPVVNWNWTFGPPGATSGLASPSYTYTTPGNFGVSLIAIDSVGCSDFYNFPNPILATEPVADFNTDFPINCLGNPMIFNNLSSGVGLSFQWNFGDNSTATVQNPVHTYQQNGLYTVSLIVTDFQGCSDTLILPNYVEIADPTIDFVPDTTFAECPPLSVNFLFQAQSNHPFSSWSWDFGDGGTGALANTSHIYTFPGSYTVSLVATAPSGCTDSIQYNNLITVGGPVGNYTFSPGSVCVGESVSFAGTGTDVFIYQWDLGGGYVPTGQQVAQAYTLPGTYTPILIVEDTAGCQVVLPTIGSLTVNPLPQASFQATVPPLCDSGLVSFLDQSSVSSGFINQWTWDFGDLSGTSSTQNPSHFYGQPGTYDVELIVTSNQGCVDTVVQTASVTVFPSPQVAIGLSDTSGCAPLAVQFSDNSPPGNAATATWAWNFGLPGANSALSNPSYTYQSASLYTPILTLTDVNGCTGSDTARVEVFPRPTADFLSNDDKGCAPLLAQFFDQSSPVIAWEWDFGDGSPVDFSEDPAHLYLADGNYDVSLKVEDVNGCLDSLTKPNYIRLAHPTANFTWSDSVICPGEPLLFTDLSSGPWPLQNWTWDFGNSLGSSIQQNPTYLYPNSGTYSVSLIVRDLYGCRDTVEKPAAITVLGDIKPDAPEIRYVSVQNQTVVQVVFDDFVDTRSDFDEYVLLRQDAAGNWVAVQSSAKINQRSFLDTVPNTQQRSYCYQLQVRNNCGTPSDLNSSAVHCTILLETTPLPDAIGLTWSPYIGWSNPVERYDIFRVVNWDINTATFLATVPGNQSQYIDEATFCYEGITYRVVATEAATSYASRSNISREVPIHQAPTETLHMLTATVEGNSFVRLSWEQPPLVARATELVIEKNEGNGYYEWHRQAITDPFQSLDDLDARVQDQAYQYRGWIEDSCLDQTPLGREASSIHLQARREQGVIYLDWTPYTEWENGIAYYELEAYQEQTSQYELIATLQGDHVSFEDRETDWEQGSLCYRIRAFEKSGNEQSSLSNESCVILDPLLYAPNAFTPNADGLNERFRLEGVFMESFHLRIYNRWGELIYETRRLDEGWDGIARGTPAPEGVYVFIAEGVGFSGAWVRRVGTVTLIR